VEDFPSGVSCVLTCDDTEYEQSGDLTVECWLGQWSVPTGECYAKSGDSQGSNVLIAAATLGSFTAVVCIAGGVLYKSKRPKNGPDGDSKHQTGVELKNLDDMYTRSSQSVLSGVTAFSRPAGTIVSEDELIAYILERIRSANGVLEIEPSWRMCLGTMFSDNPGFQWYITDKFQGQVFRFLLKYEEFVRMEGTSIRMTERGRQYLAEHSSSSSRLSNPPDAHVTATVTTTLSTKTTVYSTSPGHSHSDRSQSSKQSSPRHNGSSPGRVDVTGMGGSPTITSFVAVAVSSEPPVGAASPTAQTSSDNNAGLGNMRKTVDLLTSLASFGDLNFSPTSSSDFDLPPNSSL